MDAMSRGLGRIESECLRLLREAEANDPLPIGRIVAQLTFRIFGIVAPESMIHAPLDHSRRWHAASQSTRRALRRLADRGFVVSTSDPQERNKFWRPTE